MHRIRSFAALGLLWPALLATVRAESAIEILGQLKSFRDGSVELFDDVAKSLEEAGVAEDSLKVSQWSNDWLSILGIQKGLTGLAKDYVLNYLGRDEYHKNNGKLLDFLGQIKSAFPKKKDKEAFDDAAGRRLQLLLKELCKAGMDLFKDGGSLHQMLSELHTLLNDKVESHITQAIKKNHKVRKVFKYLTGPRHGHSTGEGNEEDEEL